MIEQAAKKENVEGCQDGWYVVRRWRKYEYINTLGESEDSPYD